MIPARYAPILFGFLVSGLMSSIVSCVATLRTVGFTAETASKWMQAWTSSWPVAFAAILIVAPAVRRLVARMVRPEA